LLAAFLDAVRAYTKNPFASERNKAWEIKGDLFSPLYTKNIWFPYDMKASRSEALAMRLSSADRVPTALAASCHVVVTVATSLMAARACGKMSPRNSEVAKCWFTDAQSLGGWRRTDRADKGLSIL
jgi:hypothetical protein